MSVDFFIPFLIGIITGFASGLMGIGGSALGTPMLRIIVGAPPLIALATPMPVMLPSSLSGGFAYLRQQKIDFKLAGWMLVTALPFTWIGAMATQYVSGQFLMILTSIFLIGVGCSFLIRSMIFRAIDEELPVTKISPPKVMLFGILGGLLGTALPDRTRQESGDAAVIGYNDEVDRLLDFTSDADAIDKSINNLQMGTTGAHLYDALSQAVALLRDRPTTRRRVIVALAEGEDTGSEAKLGQVLREAELSNVVIYTVGLSSTGTLSTGGIQTRPCWQHRHGSSSPGLDPLPQPGPSRYPGSTKGRELVASARAYQPRVKQMMAIEDARPACTDRTAAGPVVVELHLGRRDLVELDGVPGRVVDEGLASRPGRRRIGHVDTS